MKKSITTLLILGVFSIGHSQYKLDQSGWSFDAGINLVDNSGNRLPFKGYSELKAMALSSPFTLGAENRFSDLFSYTGRLSINQWKANEGVIDKTTISEDISYLSMDGGLKFYVDQLILSNTRPNWFELYLEGGLGYFNIDSAHVSLNFGGGSIIWLSKSVGINLQLMSKFIVINKVNYGTNHYQSHLGFKFIL